MTHPLGNNLPTVSFFPKPRFRQIMMQPSDPMNVTEMQMVVHLGTHVDAPRHFYSDGPAFHEIPLERLHGSGVVWRIDKLDYGLIDVADLERASPDVRAGDIVALCTGWSAYFSEARYHRHPCLSTAAAEWLVDKRVKLLAVDFTSPDLAVNRRQPGFDWPVHHVLLRHGVLVCEHAANLHSLAGCRAEFIFAALNIENSDGSPARVMARRLTQYDKEKSCRNPDDPC
ncbi:cyclase family protein [Candidimonas nitroreducens]|uniref:cyclase family protein n=1 Tax=Candidimonas nitroreducens TaxID=683354 RepID=UPI001303332A|nr:cyclase family protein [Candidimonas nitroreducens]